MERYIVKRAFAQAPFKPLVSPSHPRNQQHQHQQHHHVRPPPSQAHSIPSAAAGPLSRSFSSRVSSVSRLSASASHSSLAGCSYQYGLLLAPRSLPKSPLCKPVTDSGRRLTTSARRSSKTPFQFLTSYAFAGKARYSEEEHQPQQDSGSDSSARSDAGSSPTQESGKIGFPADSDIGRWRDALLRGGEAGEDALLCADMAKVGDKAIGVADGVGGWTESGIDPSLFSQSLMFHASRAAELASADPDTATKAAGANGAASQGVAPKAILQEAFDSVLKEPSVVAGSATACILTLDSTSGILRSANLGDSGFTVLRLGKAKPGVLYASPPQQLGFNTPLQLAKLPAEMRQEGSISNQPRDAATWECQLQHGDLIIVGTDGLFDNVDSRVEIPQFAKFIKEKHHAKYVAQHPEGSEKRADSLDEDREFVEVLASNLVEYTKICQNSQTKQSPFEREAAKYGIHFPGGKVDDVAIVCCLVIEN